MGLMRNAARDVTLGQCRLRAGFRRIQASASSRARTTNLSILAMAVAA
jgi:hypothetical protein